MLSMSISKILPWFLTLQTFSISLNTISKILFNNAKEWKGRDLIFSHVCMSFGTNHLKTLSMRYGDTVQNTLYLSSKRMIIKKGIQLTAQVTMIFEVSHQIQWAQKKKEKAGTKKRQIASGNVLTLTSSLPKQYWKILQLNLEDQWAQFHPRYRSWLKLEEARRHSKTLSSKRQLKFWRWNKKDLPDKLSLKRSMNTMRWGMEVNGRKVWVSYCQARNSLSK